MLALTLADGVGLNRAMPVRASSMGPGYVADVLCDTFLDKITVNGRAGAAPEFESQQIYYSITLYQDGVGSRPLVPPAEGSFIHTRTTYYTDPVVGLITSTLDYTSTPAWTISPGPGSYAIHVDYWWWDGSAWIGPSSGWSNIINYAYTGPTSSYWCDLDITQPLF
jgi:hypothetical protein